MSSLMDSAIKRSQMLKEWREWTRRIAYVAKKIIPDVETYVIGSVIRGDSVSGSDVDVLLVSKHVPEKLVDRAKLKAIIEEELNLPFYHPFEIHMLKPEEAGYYIERSRSSILRIA
ncbi:MAG: nucleotidyltransferase domain-containing protein [Candidatus Nezhaarchaeales archaeon]|nr:MAG: DNA polymerase subunit beta [Candidatus Nezhaarchaeota archaeon WYZ-LMO8]